MAPSTAFHKALLGDSHSHPAIRRLKAFPNVSLYVPINENKAKLVDTAKLFKDDRGFIVRTLHGNRLPAGRVNDHIVISDVKLIRGCEGIAYQYTYTCLDGISRIHQGMVSGSLYVFDSRACLGRETAGAGDWEMLVAEEITMQWDSINFSDLRLHDLVPSHVATTKAELIRDGRVVQCGRLKMTVHPDDVPDNNNCLDFLGTTPTGFKKLRVVVRFIIVDGHHRYAAMQQLRNDSDSDFDWTRQPLSVFYKIRKDESQLGPLDTIKHSRSLNNGTSDFMPCTSF